MGAINYRTSSYITMGLKPYDISDFENDTDLMSEIQEEIKEYGGTTENCIYDLIESYYENDRENIESILSRYSFYYFHVSIKPGYYEGFYLDIENNFSVALDSWEDRREAMKEITRLKAFLMACIDAGLVQVLPGWCTSYKTPEESREALNVAIKEMREDVKHTPTWAQYERENY